MPDTLPQSAPEAAAGDDELKLVMDVRGLSKRYRMTSPVTRTDKDGHSFKDNYYQALKDVSFKVWSGDRVGIICSP